MSENKPLARKAEIVVQEFEKEILIYDLRVNKALALNETSAIVWQLCNGNNTVAGIADKMSVALSQIVTEDLVLLSIEELKRENLIDLESVKLTTFDVLSRREMVRKIGFASMIALPVVSSLVAPFAVNAQSTCSTAPPGGVLCRCPVGLVPNVGDNCGTNFALGDICNAGCTCQRTAASCPTTGPLAGTCQGNCV